MERIGYGKRNLLLPTPSRRICSDKEDGVVEIELDKIVKEGTIKSIEYRIELLTKSHWEQVKSILKEGIEFRLATLETEVPSWQEWDRKHLKGCRLVVIDSEEVLGWAALLSVSDRKVYSGVAEVSIYMKTQAQNMGIGKTLMKSLISESEKNGLWTLQASIFPENQASISLHKSLGFREVGTREKIGKLSNEWKDILLLERRSKKIGL